MGRGCRPASKPSSRAARAVALAIALAWAFTAVAAAATISGTVIENGGVPLSGLEVRAYDAASGDLTASGVSAVDGTYAITGLPSASYQVRTWNPGGIWVDQWYQGLNALVYGRLAANVVDVSGGDQAGVDFALDQFSISGAVTAVGGEPLEGVAVIAYDGSWAEAGRADSAADGTYRIAGLARGQYAVRTANGLGYVDRWYGGPAVSYGTGGLTVDLNAGPRSGVDFALGLSRTISGLVSDEVGNPLFGAGVWAMESPSGAYLDYMTTSISGQFSVTVPAGTAEVSARLSGYLPGSILIDTTMGDATSGADLALIRARTIKGAVADALGNPLVAVYLQLRNEIGGYLTSTTTSAAGAFQFGNLAPGTYGVMALGTSGYIDEFYDNVHATVNDWTAATLIVVGTDDVSGIDFLLESPTVAGTVTDGATGLPVPEGSTVELVYSWSSNVAASTTTAADGSYFILAPEANRYHLRTSAIPGYFDQWYGGGSVLLDPQGSTGAEVDLRTGPVAGADIAVGAGVSISGTVTDEGGGALEGVQVEARAENGAWVVSAATDVTGAYSMGNLPPGVYNMLVDHRPGFVGEWYQDLRLDLGNTESQATPIDATWGDVAGIDFALTPTRTISGTVTDEWAGPLEGVTVSVYGPTGDWKGQAGTAADGTYVIGSLAPGTYKPHASLSNYRDTWYDGLQADQGHDVFDASPVDVSVSDATGVDFQLPRWRTVSGTVTDLLGNPLPHIQVWVHDPSGGSIRLTDTDGSGAYAIGNLPAGSYRVRAAGGESYASEWFNDIPIGTDMWLTLPAAAPVDTTLGDQSGIDFALAPAYAIAGTVSAADSGAAVTAGWVTAYSDATTKAGESWLQSDGTYRIAGLAPGTYKLKFTGYYGYLAEWWDGRLIRLALGYADADPVEVTTADVAGVDFTLEPYRQISGRVRNPLGVPLGGVLVSLYTRLGAPTEYRAWTSGDGTYTIGWLPPDTYAVRTSGIAYYLHEWYNDKPVALWTALGADWVSTETGSQTGIDFTLAWDDTATPETGLVFGPRNGFATAEQLLMRGTASDDAWVRRVELSSDGGSTWTAAEITARSDNGRYVEWEADLGSSDLWPEGTPHRVLVRAVDGLLSADPSPLDIPFVTDYEVPILTWDAPADGAEISGGEILLTGTLADTGSGAKAVRVRLRHAVYGQKVYDVAMAEDTDIFDYVYPGASTWEARLSVPTGLVSLEVWGVDAAGNLTAVLGPRHVESSVPPPPPTPPVTTLLWGPEGGFANLADLRIQGAARDDDWIETVEYSLDDGATWAETPLFTRDPGGANAVWILDLPSVGVTPLDGDAYHVLVRSIDGEGVVGSPLDLAFVLDLTPPPVPTWDAPLDGLLTTEPVVVFSGSAADDRSGVRRVVIEVEASGGVVSYLPPLAADPDPSDDVYPLDTPWQMDITLPGGVVRARAMSMDAAGNPSDPTPWRTLTIEVGSTTSTTVPSTTTTTAPTPTGLLTYQAAVGWNLLAGGPGSDILGQTLYHYSVGSYASLGGAAMAAGRGYWVRFASAGTLSLVTVDTPLTVHLYPGWNQIGNSTQNQVSLPPGLTAFVFAGGSYASHTVLEPGQGSWVKVAAEQDVVLE